MNQQGKEVPGSLSEVQTYITSPVSSEGYRYCVIPMKTEEIEEAKADFMARGWEWIWSLDDTDTGMAKVKFRKKEEKKL